MPFKFIYIQFLAAIFAVPFENGIASHSLIMNESDASLRHVFHCPPRPTGGCNRHKGCLYADPDNCHHYYICLHDKPIRKNCPDNGYGGRDQWDDIKKKCVHKTGLCHNRKTTTTEPTTTTTTTTEPTTTTTEPTTTTTEPTTPTTCTIPTFPGCPVYCIFTPDANCSFPNPNNCNSYIRCEGISSSVINCDPNMEWDNNLKQCVNQPSPTCCRI